MDRIGRVLPSFMRITELGKIGRKGISVKENGMVGVDSANDVVNLVVKLDEPTVLGIGRLVEWVVASNPFVAFVVLGELRPKPEDAILEVLMIPDYRELSFDVPTIGTVNIQFAIWLPLSECQSVFCPPGAAWRSRMV